MRYLILCLTILSATPASAEVPRVATDILPVQSLVARAMEGLDVPALVVPSNASPHAHAMRPSEAAALERADIVFWMGPSLTPWLEGAIESLARDATVVSLLDVQGTRLREYGEDPDHGEGHGGDDGHGDGHDHDHDHDHGDDHGHDHGDGIDPHAWLDPDNGRLWLGAIAEALAAADPENAARYRSNALAGQSEIDATTAEMEAMLSPIARWPFLTFHDAYGYLKDRFGLNHAGSIRLGDATAPGVAHVADLGENVATGNISCIFAEPQFDMALARTIAAEGGAKVAVLDPLGSAHAPGAGLYTALLQDIARDIASCLSP